jgi:RNA polymerase sigma factor for flagellar operon FliA
MSNVESAYGALLDEQERNRLLMEELPQVRYIARHIHDRLPQHVPLDDLVHAGVLGLMDALQKYDSGKNVQFKTYAKFRIRGAILDSLREMDWSPRDLRRKARQLEDVTSKLGTELGRAATEQELAEALGVNLEEFHHMLNELEGLDIGSLQISTGTEGHEEDMCEFLPGDPAQSPYYQCLKSEMRQILARSIGELSEKEQQVLSLYYYEELTMKEVGEVLHVGESRVSQIHSLAIVRLRTRLQELLAGKSVPPEALAGHLASALGASWKKS